VTGLVLTGDPAVGDDCQNALFLGPAANVEVDHCDFWGIQSSTVGSGALLVQGFGRVHLHDMFVVGCGSKNAGDCGVIVLDRGASHLIESVRCVDFDIFGGVAYNKVANSKAWIYVARHNDDPQAGDHAVGYTRIEGCYFDEAAIQQILLSPTPGNRLDRVKIAGCYFNVANPVGLLDAITVKKTRSLVVEDTTFTLAQQYGAKAIVASDVDLLRVVRCNGQESQNSPKRLVMGSGVQTFVEADSFTPDAVGPSDFAIDCLTGLPQKGYVVQSGRTFELPSNVGTPIGWWQADSGLVLAAGSKVVSWSGNVPTADPAMVLVQAVDALRPVYIPISANFNTRPGIRFSAAAASRLTSNGAFAAPWAQPTTYFFVVRILAASLGFQVIVDGLAAGVENQVAIAPGTNAIRLLAGAVLNGAADVFAAGVVVICAIFDGANSEIYINDMITPDGGPANAGAQNATGLTVGAAFDGTSPADMDLEEIIAFAGHMNARDRGIVAAYLGNKAAIAGAGDGGIATAAG
jgi:hypothetical protein